MRTLLRSVGLLLGLAVLGLLVGLSWAHVEIRSIEPLLPGPRAMVERPFGARDLPVRVWLINTASQRTTRAGVLEPSMDPDPDAPYTMSVPAFALEWADGRLFMIDLGMSREAAAAFGAPSELLFDADPMEPLGSVARQLGDAVPRVAGVGFTHLHTDHTNGSIELCASSQKTIPLFQGALQAETTNYTTRPGVAEIETAGCLEPTVLGDAGMLAVPGFDGLRVLPVAGHTPGSQVFVAHMAESSPVATWVFTGDAVNHVEGVRQNLPKPTLYSLLVVPESPRRLESVRLLLREAWGLPGVGLLVSHDEHHLAASGVPAWPGSLAANR